MKNKRGIAPIIAALLLFAGVIIIGILVIKFDAAQKFFSGKPFLVGLGVIFAVIFFGFVNKFLIQILLPLLKTIIQFFRSILKV